jgi:glutathione S-transferase
MTRTLYYINGCPGARAVRLYCRHVGISIDEVLVNLQKGEHMTEEFLRLNPMHTVPTIKLDNGDGIYESRLILKYLSGQYDNNPSKDIYEIDKWLFWDLGFLNTNVGKVIYPRLFMNSEPTKKDVDRLVEKLEYLDKCLVNQQFLINNSFSIADISSSMLVFNSQVRKDLVDINNYENIARWLKNVENKFKAKDWNTVMGEFFKWRDSN